MAGLYNLKKIGKFWHCDFMVLGIRVHKSTKRGMKAEAEDQAKQWWGQALDKANGIKLPLTLREVYTAWAKVKKGQFSESHLRDMRVAVMVHAALWLDRPLKELGNGAVEDIRATYLATEGQGFKINGGSTVRKHSKGGANQVIKQLRALCGWAVDMEEITACPFRVKKLKPQEKARPVLWPEQVKAFIEEADLGGRDSWSKKEDRKPPQTATALRMMVGLGLREGEAIQADWGWVDWRRSVFVVGGMAIGRDVLVKNRSIREVPIPAWLVVRVFPARVRNS